MADAATIERRRWYTPEVLGRALRELRRYPVAPLVLMFVVLILPAFFADLVVPHDPIVSDLSAPSGTAGMGRPQTGQQDRS